MEQPAAVISDLCGISTTASNGRAQPASGSRADNRTGWELLGWAILEQAVDDLALLCRWGLITPEGHCRPWPKKRKWNGQYLCYVNRQVGTLRGPFDHKQLRAWFNSKHAAEFCDLIGCNLDAKEIYETTLRNNAK